MLPGIPILFAVWARRLVPEVAHEGPVLIPLFCAKTHPFFDLEHTAADKFKVSRYADEGAWRLRVVYGSCLSARGI